MLTRKEISEILKTLKGDKTNKDLCLRGNLSEAQFGKWLKGETSIRLEEFSKVCDAAGIDISDALKSDNAGELPPAIASLVMAIREESLTLWREVEGGKENSLILKLFLDHIRNLKETLIYINENNELPAEFDKREVAEILKDDNYDE